MSKRCLNGNDGPAQKKEMAEDSVDSAMLEKANKEIERLQKLFEGACREAGSALLRAEEAESRLDVKPFEIVALQKVNDELSEKIFDLANEVDRLKSEVASSKTNIALLKMEKNSLTTIVNTHVKTINALTNELTQLRAESMVKRAAAVAADAADAAEHTTTDLERVKCETISKIDSDASIEKNSLTATIMAQAKTIEEQSKEIRRLKNENVIAGGAARAAQAEIEKLNNRINELRMETSSKEMLRMRNENVIVQGVARCAQAKNERLNTRMEKIIKENDALRQRDNPKTSVLQAQLRAAQMQISKMTAPFAQQLKDVRGECEWWKKELEKMKQEKNLLSIKVNSQSKRIADDSNSLQTLQLQLLDQLILQARMTRMSSEQSQLKGASMKDREATVLGTPGVPSDVNPNTSPFGCEVKIEEIP